MQAFDRRPIAPVIHLVLRAPRLDLFDDTVVPLDTRNAALAAEGRDARGDHDGGDQRRSSLALAAGWTRGADHGQTAHSQTMSGISVLWCAHIPLYASYANL